MFYSIVFTGLQNRVLAAIFKVWYYTSGSLTAG